MSQTWLKGTMKQKIVSNSTIVKRCIENHRDFMTMLQEKLVKCEKKYVAFKNLLRKPKSFKYQKMNK